MSGSATWRVWVAAARPRTLPAAVAPVLIGTALAVRAHAFHAPAAVAALIGALLLQIGTNFANDYYDHAKGADTAARLGPTRATAAGLVAPATMRRAFVAAFAVALVLGTYLVARGGVAIALIGALGIACGILYTGGPRPLGYLGLGEAMVLVFFGPVATAGTLYVQALEWRMDAAIAGLAPGALATCLLVVNNLRDIDTDRAAGKRTLAVRFGARFAKAEYALGLAAAAAVPVLLWRCHGAPAIAMLASLTVVTATSALAQVVRARPGDRLQHALAATGRSLAVFGVVLAATLVLG